MSDSASSSSRLCSCLVVERVVGDDPHAEPGHPPPDRPPDGAETDQPDRPAGQLPGAEALIRDGAVAEHLSGADVGIGAKHVPGGGEQQCQRHLGDRVGVATRSVQYRDAGRGRARDVDVVGIAAGGCNRSQTQIENRAADRIALHHNDIRALGRDPFGQLLGAVDAQRALVDPGVVDHVGQPPQFFESFATQRGRHQSTGHDCPCWRTVTPVSRKSVTIGIDIGTTAVKAVAAEEDGRVVARARIPHELRVPAPDRLEHNADEAWRQGPLAALEQLARPDALAVAVSAMVPSLTAVDAAGTPITPGLLYGDGRGRVRRRRR